MTPEAVWTSRAEVDLLREFSRLEDFSENSGYQLLELVDSALRLLRMMPEMAPHYTHHYRRLVLRDRRFGLFYSVEQRGIVLHAVCDLRQDRETILRHLGIRPDEG